jgi:hypothetical protein
MNSSPFVRADRLVVSIWLLSKWVPISWAASAIKLLLYNPAVFSTLPLRSGINEYFLCRRVDDCKQPGLGKPAPLIFQDQTAALYFLRSVISDSGRMHDLRLWLLEDNDSFAMYAIEDHDVMERVARMLASGRLTAVASGEGGAEGETEGILRGDSQTVGVQAAGGEAAAEATPLQDEAARRESAVAEMEEAVAAAEPAEAPPALTATVDADQPPDLAASAATEEYPKFSTVAEVEEGPTVETQAQIEEPPGLVTVAEIEPPPTLGTDAAVDAPPALETDATVDGPSIMATDVDVAESPALDTDVQLDDPPTRRPSSPKKDEPR